MKCFLALFCLVLCFSGCSSKENTENYHSAFSLDLEKQAIEREFRNDTAFLSSVMDTTFIELSGEKLKNKHEVLRAIFQNNQENLAKGISLDSFKLEDPLVNNYSGSAVVTFILHTYRKKEGVPFERRTRFYDVWVKRGKEWKAVTWQATPL